MRRVLAIAGRELSAFFRGATAPVVVTGFLLLAGLFFTLFALGYSQLSLEAQKTGRLEEAALTLADGVWQPLAVNLAVFLLFLLPAVTMRLFAEEYRSGRYDLIMTWPVPEPVWVAGKFLAALSVGLLLVAAAGGLWVAGLVWMGRPEGGPLVAAFAGLLLAAATVAAWGIFFSTLFALQVVAYVMTFASMLLLYLAAGLEPHVPAAVGRIAVWFSFTEHFRRFARGLIDSRDVLYFAGLAALGLTAAAASLAGRRLAGARRVARWAPTAALAVLLAVLAVLAGRYPLTLDLTRNRRYSPAPQTVAVLRDLRADVRAVAFYQRLDPQRRAVETLLSAFADRSPRFRWEMADPDRDLARLQELGVTTARTVVLEADGRRRSLSDPDESALVNAVYRLATATAPVVYYLVGHGEHRLDSDERAGYSAFARELQEEGYRLAPLLLADEPLIPPDAAAVVVSAPKVDPTAAELAALDRHLRDGGSLLVLADPGTPPALAAWLLGYNIRLGGDYLVTAGGPGAALGLDPRVAVVDEGYDGDHPVTRSLVGLATFFPFAQSLAPAHAPPPGFAAVTILSTGPRSWADRDSSTIAAGRPRYTEGVDRPGPLPLGVAVEIDRARFFGLERQSAGPQAPATDPGNDPIRRELEAPAPPAPVAPSVFGTAATARLLVIGDSDFASNTNLELYGNRDLLLNAAAWLARDPVLVQLRPRERVSQPRVLAAAEKKLLGWTCIVGWPALAGAACLAVVLRRRRG